MPRDVKSGRPASAVRHVIVLGLAVLALAPAAAGADGPSAGLLLRRARYAIAEGRPQEAAAALRAARAAEPRTRRGLEAALLLADLELARGDARAADAVLGAAERDFPDGDAGAEVLLARGWLAVARADGAAALRHFQLVAGRTEDRPARELALLGSAWARLVAPDGAAAPPPAELATLAASSRDPVLRIGALLSLARAHAARGEHRKALRRLRALRRLARGTSFADDVELGIGLVQLDMGAAAAARKTLTRLAAQDDAPEAAALPDGASVLTLTDVRLAPAALAGRLAQLYAARRDPSMDVLRFLVAALDRPARRDARAALSLVDAALAARKDA